MSYDERSMLNNDLAMLRYSMARKCLDIIAMHEPWFEIKPDEEGNVMVAPKNITTNPIKTGRVGKQTTLGGIIEY